MWARLIGSEGGHGEPRGLLDFLWAYWLCFQSNELWVAAYVCVLLYCWVSIYMCCANLALTLIKCLNIDKRYPVYLVDRFHYYIAIIPCCRNVSIFISLFVISSSSKVKEKGNPPFLSTSRRRSMCTAPYIDSNAEEGKTFQNIFMACTEPFQRGITQYYLCAVIR